MHYALCTMHYALCTMHYALCKYNSYVFSLSFQLLSVSDYVIRFRVTESIVSGQNSNEPTNCPNTTQRLLHIELGYLSI
jgi:hypothetical protein